MDFIDQIGELAERARKQEEVLENNEAATIQVLILPFIRLLGYNDEDTSEVWPEYPADAPDKKSKKVDYAIFIDGSPTILFECKALGVDLTDRHSSQLWEYFTAVKTARFGVLTNGITYRFFSDIDDTNLMDEKPFLELNLSDIRESLVEEVEKFTKADFDVDSVFNRARELKYTREIKNILIVEYESPTDEFISFCRDKIFEKIYSDPKQRPRKSALKKEFKVATKRAFHQFVDDCINKNKRQKSALDADGDSQGTAGSVRSDSAQFDDQDGRRHVTTEDEQEAIEKSSKKRPPFSFRKAKIDNREVLTFSKDESKTAIVVSDRKIKFNGERTSLSKSAKEILNEMGYKSQAVAGPDYWQYEGETLSKRRQRMEEESYEDDTEMI